MWGGGVSLPPHRGRGLRRGYASSPEHF